MEKFTNGGWIIQFERPKNKCKQIADGMSKNLLSNKSCQKRIKCFRDGKADEKKEPLISDYGTRPEIRPGWHR